MIIIAQIEGLIQGQSDHSRAILNVTEMVKSIYKLPELLILLLGS